MSNKDVREIKELQSLFADPKYSRQAWQSVGKAILLNPCSKPIPSYDKNGNESMDSLLQQYSYSQLKRDIATLAKEDREPTEIEMILKCQMVKARCDTSAATFVRDTLGAKPVDESKLSAQLTNPYESLSDEELELLAAARAKREAIDVEPEPTSSATLPIVERDDAD